MAFPFELHGAARTEERRQSNLESWRSDARPTRTNWWRRSNVELHCAAPGRSVSAAG